MTTRLARAIVQVWLVPTLAFAQAPPGGRLSLTVGDQTGAVIPGAKVIVTRLDGPEPRGTQSGETTEQGIATIVGLAPGRYAVRVEFPGFDTATLPDVRIRAGDNRQRIVLAIQKVEDTVTVGQDPQRAASDPRGNAFGTTLTREQIDALSDDPDELQRQLQEMAGVGALIKVDSFEGAQLPPKSQIRMIRISRDAFAAENHFAGGIQIDIITQPGIGPLRGNANTRLIGAKPHVVQFECRRRHVVRDAQSQRRAAHGHALGGATHSAANRSTESEPQPRSRLDEGPDAAHGVQPIGAMEPQPRHR
jgi:Carboxypeptidase regulatory-like domain